ncbi:MAG: thrombospondin type 3 repeat-containing protein [Candidatus Uhrbacteria bacterium]|nr:thrombospondin type 3 repeat-containing protein [Candidatus Uhrbacteria bacterium]
MPDLSNRQFYEVNSEKQKPNGSAKSFVSRKMLIKSGIAVGVLLIVLLISMFVSNMLASRKEAIDVAVTIAEAESMIQDGLGDCAGDADVDACEARLRKGIAREIGEAEVCVGLAGDAYVDCISLIAYDNSDLQACQMLEDSDFEDCEDIVLLNLAEAEVSFDRCGVMHGAQKKITCENLITGIVVKAGRCDEYGLDPYLCDANDWLNYVLESGDPELCEVYIAHADIENCYEAINGRDEDKDGLYLIDEFAAGSSDQDADTDDDGLSDFNEVRKYGTSPIDSDTDGDGYSDGTEVLGGFDPLS